MSEDEYINEKEYKSCNSGQTEGEEKNLYVGQESEEGRKEVHMEGSSSPPAMSRE